MTLGCSKKSTEGSASRLQSFVPTVAVSTVAVKSLATQLTISSELVPFQEIDVYAKESGYLTDLRVDYGSRVHQGDLMATLEIPELEQLISQDRAAVKRAKDETTHAQYEINRMKAQENVAHLEYTRLKGVADSRPGLVAQQEVDNAQGRDLAAQAQVEAGQAALLAAQSQWDEAKAKQQHDEVLLDYSKIIAPFTGVVTQRYANLGTLMQAGTASSTQSIPLVRLSEDDKFRLVIPVAESYVKYIAIGDPVQVNVPSFGKVFRGRVTRISVDVARDTRTMHTEVDVENPARILLPGLYAEATLYLQRKGGVLAAPIQAVSQEGSDAIALVVGPDNRIAERKLTLGLQTANEAEILRGLSQGDRVVVSDRSGLKPGMEVNPQPANLIRYPDTGQ